MTHPAFSTDDVLDATAVDELRQMGPVVVDRILPRYIRNATEAGAAIAAAADRGDLVAVASLAHKLRGSSGTMAGVVLSDTCAILEAAAEDGDEVMVTTMAPVIPEHVAATCQALRNALR